MREKEFEKKVKEYLASIGVYQAGTQLSKMLVEPKGWFTKIWGGGYQKSGIPDLVLCVNGFFVAVELKAEKGKVSELQKVNISRINESNGIGIVLYPDGFESFKKIMEGVSVCDLHTQELKRIKNALTNISCDIVTEY